MSVTTAHSSVATDLAAEPRGWLTSERLAGLSALAFGGGVLVANAVVFGAPMADASPAEAADFYKASGPRLSIANAMVGLTFPALLLFAGAMFDLSRDRAIARRWMVVGGLGGASMVGVFSLLVAANIAGVHLAGSPAGFAVAWTLHFAAFAINMTALGTAFLGFSLGAHAAGIIPSWQRSMGVLGATLLLLAGIPNTAVAEGSPLGAPGFAGFLLWLVWILVTGVRLLRSRPGA